jgi:hypothetical protein
MRTQLRLTALVLAVSSLLAAGCGGGSPAGTSPSPSASPSPSPAPAASPTPSPAQGGNSLSVSPQTIQGQGQPQATVTLAAAAPDGGALVVLTSDNLTAARVPSTVTVAAGSRSATFLVDTSTVLASTTVTIVASYAGNSMAATLTVTPPPVSASFVVRSQTRGAGACVIEQDAADFDCLLDGSSSTGFVGSWIWTYTMGTTTLGHTSSDAGSHMQISTKCAFLNTATGGDGPNGERYLNMVVALQVQDRGGVRSGPVQQNVKVYPNHNCGFSY